MRVREARAVTRPATGGLLLAITASLAACQLKPIPRDPMAAPATSAAAAVDPSKVVSFSFPDLDGKEVSTATVHGRTTVVFFGTAYDTFVQAEARFLIDVEHLHTPRLNVVMIMLERAENRPMVSIFSDVLQHPFPICMADADTIAGHGPFQGMNSVPSLLILDKEGREKYRHAGMQKEEEIEAAIKSVE